MRSALGPILFLCGCGQEIPYTPVDQNFEDFADWGDGISGLSIVPSAPIDTGSGSGNVDGIYSGFYNVTATVAELALTCSCTSSPLTIAITSSEIQVGQGTQCAMDCGYTTTLRVRGSVDGTGYATGALYEEDSFVFETTWSGAFLNGTGTGTFMVTGIATGLGTTDYSGNFTVIQGG